MQIKNLVSFEPSHKMYPILENRLRKNSKVETINAYFRDKFLNFEDKLDAIVYVNVLEHLKDDGKELSCVYKTLREKGYVLII